MSPIILFGASFTPMSTLVIDGCWSGLSARASGRQIMNVNLSGSVRQLFCMAYSSSRLSGSEAVAVCRSPSYQRPDFLLDDGQGEKEGVGCHVLLTLILHPLVINSHVVFTVRNQQNRGRGQGWWQRRVSAGCHGEVAVLARTDVLVDPHDGVKL